MAEHIPVDCRVCKRGYKTGFFENCPHCGAPTGEKLGTSPKKEDKGIGGKDENTAAE